MHLDNAKKSMAESPKVKSESNPPGEESESVEVHSGEDNMQDEQEQETEEGESRNKKEGQVEEEGEAELAAEVEEEEEEDVEKDEEEEEAQPQDGIELKVVPSDQEDSDKEETPEKEDEKEEETPGDETTEEMEANRASEWSDQLPSLPFLPVGQQQHNLPTETSSEVTGHPDNGENGGGSECTSEGSEAMFKTPPKTKATPPRAGHVRSRNNSDHNAPPKKSAKTCSLMPASGHNTASTSAATERNTSRMAKQKTLRSQRSHPEEPPNKLGRRAPSQPGSAMAMRQVARPGTEPTVDPHNATKRHARAPSIGGLNPKGDIGLDPKMAMETEHTQSKKPPPCKPEVSIGAVEVSELKKRLQVCIDDENFTGAAVVNSALKQCQSCMDKLQACMKNQDLTGAAMLQSEIKSLVTEVDQLSRSSLSVLAPRAGQRHTTLAGASPAIVQKCGDDVKRVGTPRKSAGASTAGVERAHVRATLISQDANSSEDGDEKTQLRVQIQERGAAKDYVGVAELQAAIDGIADSKPESTMTSRLHKGNLDTAATQSKSVDAELRRADIKQQIAHMEQQIQACVTQGSLRQAAVLQEQKKVLEQERDSLVMRSKNTAVHAKPPSEDYDTVQKIERLEKEIQVCVEQRKLEQAADLQDLKKQLVKERDGILHGTASSCDEEQVEQDIARVDQEMQACSTQGLYEQAGQLYEQKQKLTEKQAALSIKSKRTRVESSSIGDAPLGHLQMRSQMKMLIQEAAVRLEFPKAAAIQRNLAEFDVLEGKQKSCIANTKYQEAHDIQQEMVLLCRKCSAMGNTGFPPGVPIQSRGDRAPTEGVVLSRAAHSAMGNMEDPPGAPIHSRVVRAPTDGVLVSVQHVCDGTGVIPQHVNLQGIRVLSMSKVEKITGKGGKGKAGGKDKGGKGKATGKDKGGTGKDRGKGSKGSTDDTQTMYVGKDGYILAVIWYGDRSQLMFSASLLNSLVNISALHSRPGQLGVLHCSDTAKITQCLEPVALDEPVDFAYHTDEVSRDFATWSVVQNTPIGTFVALVLQVRQAEERETGSTGEAYMQVQGADMDGTIVGPLRFWRHTEEDIEAGQTYIFRGVKVASDTMWSDDTWTYTVRPDGGKTVECKSRTAIEKVSHIDAIMNCFT